MALQYSTTHRNNGLADITTQAGTTAHLAIYTGAAPANCGTADAATLLVSLPMSNPIAAAPSGGVLTMSAITATAAAATGAAAHWRIYPTATTTGTDAVAQGTVGTSGADLNFPSVSFTSGETISISSFTITANGA